MPSARKKRKVSNLTVDNSNVLLRILAEQVDEEDENLPKGLTSGLQQLPKKHLLLRLS